MSIDLKYAIEDEEGEFEQINGKNNYNDYY